MNLSLQLFYFKLSRVFEDSLDARVSWTILRLDFRHVQGAEVRVRVKLVARGLLILLHNLTHDSRRVRPIEVAAHTGRLCSDYALLQLSDLGRRATWCYLFLEHVALEKAGTQLGRPRTVIPSVKQCTVRAEVRRCAHQGSLIADISSNPTSVRLTLQHLRWFIVVLRRAHFLLVKCLLSIGQLDALLLFRSRCVLGCIESIVELRCNALVDVSHLC